MNKTLFNFIFIFFLAALVSCNRMPRNFPEAMSDTFQGEKGFFHLKVPPALLQVVIKGEESVEMLNMLEGLNQVGVMSFGNQLPSQRDELEIHIDKWLNFFQYSDLITISESGSKISFKILEKNAQIQELMGIYSNSEGVVIITLYGNLNIKQVMNITKQLNTDMLRGLVNRGS